MKKFLAIAFFLCANYVFAQDTISTGKDSAKSDGKIFTIVEEMPQFPGGEKAMFKFIADSIQYPADLKEIKGRKVVYVNFVVDIDGSLTGIKILRGVTKSADDEVMRVMKLMPKWTPGKQNGKTVRVQFNLPVAFENK
ncbi:MAG TPA: energy transducer TonB [Bacteroidia bacterium]|nr:energy transducer TonB [Bacteroidia bacterium]